MLNVTKQAVNSPDNSPNSAANSSDKDLVQLTGLLETHYAYSVSVHLIKK